MPTFIVVHGSVSGKQIGESIEMTQEQADHINSSGKMLRGEKEKPEPKKRVDSVLRTGVEGTKVTKIGGNVISQEADGEELEEPAAEAEPEVEAPKPAKAAKKTPAKAAKKGA